MSDAMNAVTDSFLPENEMQRMAAVRRYDILDTPPDGSFDRITAMAARRFGVPISIVSIVDHDRIWFKSHHGVPASQIGRDPGLCASAILSSDPISRSGCKGGPPDAREPARRRGFGLRFYAGVPLRTGDGHNLGTLCVIDREPRPVDQDQIDDLKDLASIVMDQLELADFGPSRRCPGRDDGPRNRPPRDEQPAVRERHAGPAEQSPDMTDTAGQLRIAANRVAAVARVHRHFYSQDPSDTVSCITFLRRLCADLSTILDTDVEIDGDEGDIQTTQIQPIGLIVNELVTNAAKHGAGKVHVGYRVYGSTRELSVCDEGEGLPVGFDPEVNGPGLGMKVVTSLARQLGGRLTATPRRGEQGCCFTVTFPA